MGVGEEVTTWKFCGVAAENSKTTAVNVMLCYFRTLNTIAEQTTRPLCVPVHDRRSGRIETENRLKKSFKKMLDKLTTICYSYADSKTQSTFPFSPLQSLVCRDHAFGVLYVALYMLFIAVKLSRPLCVYLDKCKLIARDLCKVS